jgi:hypothetical protein
VFFLAVGLLPISFFSVGIPEYVAISETYFHQRESTEGVLLNNYYPLSFPFYSSVYYQKPFAGAIRDSSWEEYRLNFLTMILHGTRISYSMPTPTPSLGFILNFSWLDYILYFSFFLLINIVGAVIGYSINKKRWLYASVLISIVVLTPLILLYNPISPIWNPPRPEVTMQGYWSNSVFNVDTTVKNSGGDGWIKVYVKISGSGTPWSGLSIRTIYFSRWENKTLKFTFDEFHPNMTYPAWVVAG